MRLFACALLLLSAIDGPGYAQQRPGNARRRKAPETILRVAIPAEVSAEARAQIAGAEPRPPVLVLEDLEVGQNEGITIEILGRSPNDSSAAKTILNVSGLMGTNLKSIGPMKKTALQVPLNESSLPILARNREIEITLRVADDPDHPALKVGRIYFREGK